MRFVKCYGKKLILRELKKSYNFFINETNNDRNSKGYGLTRDKTILANHIASIASVGYGLAALIVGVEHKWIKYEEAYYKANRTLDTFINNVEGKNGFYYHFINMETGKREWNCEISIIDTAIFICGAITSGEYFGKEVKEKAEILYKRVNWEWYRNKETNYFYMGYTPEKGFWGHWDMYAEQLMLYVLGVSSPRFPISKSMYNDFKKKKENYKNIKDIIYTYCGTLFTYQFSHAWIDFRNILDENSINWFENSIKATKANRQYCIDNKEKFKTYGENSWGLTACLGPNGYCSFGSKPCDINLEVENDGTITPCGAIGSIVFTPKESIKAMEFYYNKFPKLWGKYGFKDGYNLEKEKPWFAKEYIGIDKGIELVMIENYLNSTIWKYFMKNKYVQQGLKKLGFVSKDSKEVIKCN
ncbi:MAG: hypothetical protein HFJ19_04305 [Clostridia bacterium]|nr:hypothetical protein [Clostridia bacterium]